MIVTTNVFLELKSAKVVVIQISEKDSFTTPFDSQHVKGSQTLAKSS